MLQQKKAAMRERATSHCRQLFVCSAADGMIDYRKAIFRHAEHSVHHLGGADKARGHDAEGGNQETFSRYGVVQTAR